MEDFSALLTVGAPVVVAIVTALGTVYIARLKTRHDIGVSITAGFKELTDQLQEERTELISITARQRQELAEKDRQIADLERMTRLQHRHNARLERLLDKAGIEIPKFE